MAAISQSLLDQGRLGLISLDRDRKIETCSGKLVSWLETGELASEALPILTGLDDVLDEIIDQKRTSFALPRIRMPEGSPTGQVLSLEITRSETPDGLQILVRDETELAELEQRVLQQRNELSLTNEALSVAKGRAEDALKEKSSFLANISHDLKTPLQVIIGNAEILRSDLPDEEREEFLQDVLDNSNFLLGLITDLLDASAIDTDQLKLTEEPVDIDNLLERILSMARQIPDGNQRRFALRADGKGYSIMADPMRLRRLLLNIISNAIKFTDIDGRIDIRAGPAESGGFVIEIGDDGCGIEPNIMRRVFEPFVSAGDKEGTGLGLHIAKGLADLHEADLDLISEPGVGTTARLSLPKSRVVRG